MHIARWIHTRFNAPLRCDRVFARASNAVIRRFVIPYRDDDLYTIAPSNSYERYATSRKGLEFSLSRKINGDCLAIVFRDKTDRVFGKISNRVTKSSRVIWDV